MENIIDAFMSWFAPVIDGFINATDYSLEKYGFGPTIIALGILIGILRGINGHVKNKKDKK